MRRYFNTDSNLLQDRQDYVTPVASLEFKRRDTKDIEIVHCDNRGNALEYSAATARTSFIFGCKLPEKLPGDYIISNYDEDESDFVFTVSGGSVFADAVVVSAATSLTSATARFQLDDIGRRITGAGIPPNTTIASVVSATAATLSAAATINGSGVTIIIADRPQVYTVRPSINSDELSDAFVDGVINRTVANAALRYALTGLALGTIVKQTTPLSYWQVTDIAQLANAAGWSLAPEKPVLSLLGEFQETTATTTESTQYFAVNIENDVIRGGEGFPTNANPSYFDEDGNLQAIVIPRKGTAAEIGAIVLKEGEVGYQTDTKTVRIGDGITPGGNTIASNFTTLIDHGLGTDARALAAIVNPSINQILEFVDTDSQILRYYWQLGSIDATQAPDFIRDNANTGCWHLLSLWDPGEITYGSRVTYLSGPLVLGSYIQFVGSAPSIAGDVTFTGSTKFLNTVKLQSFTVAALPSPVNTGVGAMAMATNATSTTPYTTVAGGGSNKVLVVSNGTNWQIH